MDIETAILSLNGLWFFAGFIQLGFAQESTARFLVPRSRREDPLAATLKASIRFLGGMNGALACLAIAMVIFPALFVDELERGTILIFFGLVNASQFAFNIPVLLGGGRQGDAYWPVLKGPMLFIFVIGAVLALGDFLLGVWRLSEAFV